MELSATAKVILGMLRSEPRSGYDIKQIVDRSTRFFWSASYGQIYPELKRLEAAGLVEGAAGGTGERARTAYRLTPAGEEVLTDWLREQAAPPEMRHEALLKLFFADVLPAGEREARLLDMREGHLAKLAELRAIQAALSEDAKGSPAGLCLRFGIEFNEWIADWCERHRTELRSPTTRRK